MSEFCLEDVDCQPTLTNKLCYGNISESVAVDSFGCACNTFYGWVGQNCTELSASSITTIVIMGSTSTICFFVVLMLLYVLRQIFKVKKCCHYSEKTLTTVFILLGSIGCMGWSLGVALSTAINFGPVLVVEPEIYADPYSGRYNFLSLVFGPLAIGATVLGLLNVTILFLDVADNTMKLIIQQNPNLPRNRIFVHSFQALCILLAVVAFAYEKFYPGGTSILGFLLGPPALIVIMAYGIGAYRMTKVLRNSGLAHQYTSMVANVRDASIAIFVALAIYLISVVAYSSLDTFVGSWKSHTSSEGYFSIAKLFHHLQIVSVMIACAAIAQFLRSSLSHPDQRTSLAAVAARLSARVRNSIRADATAGSRTHGSGREKTRESMRTDANATTTAL